MAALLQQQSDAGVNLFAIHYDHDGAGRHAS
jgi:hypothetical protein